MNTVQERKFEALRALTFAVEQRGKTARHEVLDAALRYCDGVHGLERIELESVLEAPVAELLGITR